MKEVIVNGKLHQAAEYEEIVKFLFGYFLHNPGSGLPCLMGASADCYEMIAMLRGGGCMDGIYITIDAGNRLYDEGVVNREEPNGWR